MNKRITSVLLCFVMVFAMLVSAVPAFAVTGKTTTLTATPDKTTAIPGETINYTVTLGAVDDLLGIKFKLIIPDGLTFVSGVECAGVKEALHASFAEYTPSTKVFLADPENYTSSSELQLMTFSCKVNDDAVGEQTVKLYIDDPDNYYDSDLDNIEVIVSNATVTVTAAPKPAESISLDKNSINLTVGDTETLTASVMPADTTDTVSWTSSNESVATVNAVGKVEALAPGSAVITATAGTRTASCTVNVEAAPCTHTHLTPVAEKASTCQEKGWDAYKKCNDCGQLFNMSNAPITDIPYRELGAHNYVNEEKKVQALKSAGTCKDRAVYYKSCNVCGAVDSDSSNIFYGEKNPDNHVGGTNIVGNIEPSHIHGIDGYTGDTVCAGCNAVLQTGEIIPAGDHIASEEWNYDSYAHWKNCSVEGCDAEIEGTRARHTSTGANVATCTHKAVCDVCGVEYGSLAVHNYSDEWSKDGENHWHACTECGDITDVAPHSPDRDEPTETEPVKCSTCGYVLVPSLGHIHDIDTDNFEYDENGHWNKCSGCSLKFNEAAHELKWVVDKEATQTEKGLKHQECTVCSYKSASVEIPAIGTEKPSEKTETSQVKKSDSKKSPQTGAQNAAAACLAAFGVGAAAVGITVYSRKKKE